MFDSYRTSYYFTNLAGTIGSVALELRDTFIFAITVIFTVVNASCQRHSIDIQTFIPVDVFGDILKYNCLISYKLKC